MTGTGATQLWGATTRRAIGTTRQDVCKGGDQPPALTAWYFLCVGRGFPDAPPARHGTAFEACHSEAKPKDPSSRPLTTRKKTGETDPSLRSG